MAIFNKFQQFVEDMAHGVHNLGTDSFQVALTTVAPVNTNTVLANLTEITYTNLSTRVATRSTSAQAAGTYDLVMNDLTLTASGGAANAFRYVVLYNTTAAGGPLICWFDYLSNLTLADGESLTVDFQSDGPTTGSLLTLA